MKAMECVPVDILLPFITVYWQGVGTTGVTGSRRNEEIHSRSLHRAAGPASHTSSRTNSNNPEWHHFYCCGWNDADSSGNRWRCFPQKLNQLKKPEAALTYVTLKAWESQYSNDDGARVHCVFNDAEIKSPSKFDWTDWNSFLLNGLDFYWMYWNCLWWDAASKKMRKSVSKRLI